MIFYILLTLLYRQIKTLSNKKFIYLKNKWISRPKKVGTRTQSWSTSPAEQRTRRVSLRFKMTQTNEGSEDSSHEEEPMSTWMNKDSDCSDNDDDDGQRSCWSNKMKLFLLKLFVWTWLSGWISCNKFQCEIKLWLFSSLAYMKVHFLNRRGSVTYIYQTYQCQLMNPVFVCDSCRCLAGLSALIILACSSRQLILYNTCRRSCFTENSCCCHQADETLCRADGDHRNDDDSLRFSL